MISTTWSGPVWTKSQRELRGRVARICPPIGDVVVKVGGTEETGLTEVFVYN
jgi:hypothetical protein